MLQMAFIACDNSREPRLSATSSILTIGTVPVRIADVLAVASGQATIRLDESPAFQQMLQRSVDLRPGGTGLSVANAPLHVPGVESVSRVDSVCLCDLGGHAG